MKFINHRILKTISMALIIFTANCDWLFNPEENEDDFILIDNELTFTMGYSWECDEIGCGLKFEKPAHMVQLSPYYIGKYEVTNEEYLKFVEAGGYTDSTYWSVEGWKNIQGNNPDSTVWNRPVDWGESYPPWANSGVSNKADCPVVGVNWFECEAYCNWLSRTTGETYRLPTEAEWERAARGPDPGNRYPWGNEWDRFKCNHLPFQSGEKRYVVPVASYKAGKSHDGCYDLAGNAYEWCFDYQITPAKVDTYYTHCKAQGVVPNPRSAAPADAGVVEPEDSRLISQRNYAFTL